jgi:hypothetical protein
MVMVINNKVMGNKVLNANRADAESPPGMISKLPRMEGIKNNRIMGGTNV